MELPLFVETLFNKLRSRSTWELGCGTGIILLSTFIFFKTIRRLGLYRKVSPNGKTVFITGCDTGFGLILAHRLSDIGYDVIAGCISEASPGAKELERVKKVRVIKCDVTSDPDVAKLVSFVDDRLKATGNVFWAVVNNAGILELGGWEWSPIESYRRHYEVNGIGVVRVTQALAPFLRRSSGRIVNVASQLGRWSVPGLAGYTMSKHAVVAFSDTIRMELRPFGVKVSMIQPWYYRTNILDGIKCVKPFWDKASDEIKRDYGATYADRFYDMNQNENMRVARTNLHEVVNSMIHAVTAVHPCISYDCHWSTTMKKWIATSIKDVLFCYIRVPSIDHKPVR